MLDKDTLVSCTDCVNWESLKPKIGYFGCHTECQNCVCGCCDCYNPESKIKYEFRPKFEYSTVVGYVHY